MAKKPEGPNQETFEKYVISAIRACEEVKKIKSCPTGTNLCTYSVSCHTLNYPQEMEMVSPNFEKGTPLSKGYPFFIRLPTSNAYTTMKKVSEEIRTVHGTAMRMAWVWHEDHTRTTPVPGSCQILQDLVGSYRCSTAERDAKPHQEDCNMWHDIARCPSPAHLAWKKPVSSKHTRFMWRVWLHCLPCLIFYPIFQVCLSSSIHSRAARATPQARHHSLHASVVLGKALTMHPGSEHQFQKNSIWNRLEVWSLASLLKLASVLDSVAPSLDSERCQSQPTVLNAWLKPLLKIMQILAAEQLLWHDCFERIKSQLTSVWSKHVLVEPMEGVAGSHLVFQNHLISEHLGQPLWAGPKDLSCCHFTNGDFGPQCCSWEPRCARQFELVSDCLREWETVENGWTWMKLITLKSTVQAAN